MRTSVCSSLDAYLGHDDVNSLARGGALGSNDLKDAVLMLDRELLPGGDSILWCRISGLLISNEEHSERRKLERRGGDFIEEIEEGVRYKLR